MVVLQVVQVLQAPLSLSLSLSPSRSHGRQGARGNAHVQGTVRPLGSTGWAKLTAGAGDWLLRRVGLWLLGLGRISSRCVVALATRLISDGGMTYNAIGRSGRAIMAFTVRGLAGGKPPVLGVLTTQWAIWTIVVSSSRHQLCGRNIAVYFECDSLIMSRNSLGTLMQEGCHQITWDIHISGFH